MNSVTTLYFLHIFNIVCFTCLVTDINKLFTKCSPLNGIQGVHGGWQVVLSVHCKKTALHCLSMDGEVFFQWAYYRGCGEGRNGRYQASVKLSRSHFPWHVCLHPAATLTPQGAKLTPCLSFSAKMPAIYTVSIHVSLATEVSMRTWATSQNIFPEEHSLPYSPVP